MAVVRLAGRAVPTASAVGYVCVAPPGLVRDCHEARSLWRWFGWRAERVIVETDCCDILAGWCTASLLRATASAVGYVCAAPPGLVRDCHEARSLWRLFAGGC